jgi:hypothetical protein
MRVTIRICQGDSPGGSAVSGALDFRQVADAWLMDERPVLSREGRGSNPGASANSQGSVVRPSA